MASGGAIFRGDVLAAMGTALRVFMDLLAAVWARDGRLVGFIVLAIVVVDPVVIGFVAISHNALCRAKSACDRRLQDVSFRKLGDYLPGNFRKQPS